MKLLSRFAVIVFVFALVPTARAEEKLFPMGVWYEGAVGKLRNDLIPEDPAEAAKMYDRDFADISAHGVNVVVVPNTPPPHHKVLLDAASKHRLNIIMELGYEG